jgi:hypothetical protein
VRPPLNPPLQHIVLGVRWYGPPPFFLTFFLQIYFQSNFFISLLFLLFFLILTCSCQYSYNLMLTSNCMCRPYIDTKYLHCI